MNGWMWKMARRRDKTLAFWALSVFAALTVPAPSSAQSGAIEQRIRQIDVAPFAGHVIPLSVIAAPKLTTHIRFAQGFSVNDVLCGGACIDAGDVGDAQAPMANWVIDKRPQQQSVHIWPARLPGPGNPVSAFTTNLYVATDDGRAYNITLQLLDLADGKRQADAVVDLVDSSKPTGAARLASLQAACREQAREELRQEARSALLLGLNAQVRCKKARFARPARDGMLVARLVQLCHSTGDSPVLWAHFELENRGDAPLRIDEVSLEPKSKSFGGQSETAVALGAQVLAGKSKLTGVVARTFAQREHGLRGWQLEVVPEPNDTSGAVRIADVHF